MALKDFITNFDIAKPDWFSLPSDWSACDLAGLSSAEVGKFNAIKGLWELSRPVRLRQGSRVWSDPEGYKWLVQWSNLVLLRFLVRLFTDSLPKSEYRRKAQADDAARSSVRNIEEGYKRATTSEYFDFIGYSQGSLEEVKGDIKDLVEDKFLKSQHGSALADVGIDLGAFHRALLGDKGRYRRVEEHKGELQGDKGRYRMIKDSKGGLEEGKEGYRRVEDSKGKYKMGEDGGGKPWDYRPLTVLYPPLANVRAQDLTYEMFLELINKTDYLLRKLVESLERKLADERKGYQISQARIRDKFHKK